jgi:hypothetical protein
MALTLDVEGTENFRYTGGENKMHVYRGKIKPGSKLKFVIKATLVSSKTLPITGRRCTARLEVIAKKGKEVIKKQNFKSDNKSNLFLNYTMPEGADALEVNETFVLNNKSTNKEYNKQITERNKLILTTTDTVTAAVSKTTGSGGTTTGKGSGKGMLAGAALVVAAIAGGGYFFMKKRKEGQAANEEIARKEKLRRLAVQRQQEQQQNLQSRQEEINQHNRMLEERLREQEQTRQPEQNAMQQPEVAGAYVAGATGVMGGVQQNAAEDLQQDMTDAAPHFCQNCGSPLKPGTRFCENCGAKVD